MYLNADVSLEFPILEFLVINENDMLHKESEWFYYGKLDWERFDKFIKNNHDKWSKQYWSGRIMYVPALPQDLDEELKETIFLIPVEYAGEIKRMAFEANKEWSYPRLFDTTIREHCLKPAIAYADCIFKLITDYVYDEKQDRKFAQYEDRFYLYNLALYKFWMYQTGRGLVWDRAYLDDFEGWAKKDNEKIRDKMKEIVMKLKAQFRLIEAQYEKQGSVDAKV